MKVIPNMLYKVECILSFTDGNLPQGYQNFTVGKVYEDIPGSVLVHMLQSGPDNFEVLGQMVPPPDVSNAARKLAEENGIDLTKVEGSGKNGAITKSDVEALVE